VPHFHETGYGRTFFEGQLPRLLKALETIADTLPKLKPTDEVEQLRQLVREAVAAVSGDEIDPVDVREWLKAARLALGKEG